MRSSLGDYQLLGSYGPGGDPDGAWLARPPARLDAGDTTVVVTEIPDPGPEWWPALVERIGDLASIQHENLPRLLEAGRTDETDGPVCWVARDGAGARAIIPTAEQLAQPDHRARTLTAMVSICRAAHALHEAGWAHGAIAPAGVLVDGRRILLAPPLAALTADPVRFGPLAEAADYDPVDPTVLWGEGPSRAGDIWSLAATTHVLVTGRLAHRELAADTVMAAAQRILIEAPEPDAGLGPELASLLGSCFAPDPADRPPTAADLADRIEKLVAA